MKKLSKVTAIFMLMITTTFSFNLSTTLFDQRIDGEEGYKEIVFKNKFIESVRYKVKILKSDEQDSDISNWVEVSPTVLNIQPLSEKVLKIFVKSPKGVKEKEYSFRLQIEPIVIPTISKVKEGVVNRNSSVSFVPIIKMYGYTGDPNFKKNINLDNITLKKSDKNYILSGTLSNNTYAGKNIGFNFIGDNNFIVEGKWIGRVNPNFKKDITIKVNEKFKEISIYDAETNKEIKRITMPKGT